MANDDRIRMIEYLLRPNASNAFEEFKTALISGDNKQIEECKVVRLFDEILSDVDCPFKTTLPQGTILYRSRRVDFQQPLNGIEISREGDIESFIGYDQYASKEPPIGSQNSARCNIAGMPYLYVAEDEYTACAELKIPDARVVSLASFIMNNSLEIIDFSKDVKMIKCSGLYTLYGFMPARMMSHIMASFTLPTSGIEDYSATQYIADRIRKYGFDGIAYQSYFSTKKNYAIFNCCGNNVSFVHSRLVQVENKGYIITSLSDNQIIQGEPIQLRTDSIKHLVRENIECNKGDSHAKA